MAEITGITGSGSDMIQSLAAMTQLLRQQHGGQVQRAGPTQAADNDGDNYGSDGSTEAADRAARHAFFNLLTDYGISPEQFRNDLLAAIQNPENGQDDHGAAFRGVAAGLTLDAVA
jgi:hypothetical protein